MRQLPTAAEAATLFALSVKRKEEELAKELSRARVSEKTVKRVTGRRRLDQRFVADLNECLLDFNLLLIDTGDAIGLLKASAVKGWPRMTAQSIVEEIKQSRRGELDFDSAAEELAEDGGVLDEEEVE
jgi:hypothetical protein